MFSQFEKWSAFNANFEMGKRLEQAFYKSGNQMDNMHMNRRSVPLVIREMQTKTTMI